MKIDCHDHTCYSPDSARTPREAVEEAVGLGIGVLAFTEHMDLGFPNDKRPEGDRVSVSYTHLTLPTNREV